MEAKIVEAIVRVGEANGLDVQPYKDYSGRGMFGATTAGVVAGSEVAFWTAVAHARAEDGGFDVLGALASVRRDELGKGLVYY